MKWLLILISFPAFAAMASDFGGVPKCGPLKFKYNDVVKVVDDAAFYAECEGYVTARSSDCTYYVTRLCGEIASHFDESQLKLLKKRTTCK